MIHKDSEVEFCREEGDGNEQVEQVGDHSKRF
jgi:hypothetical protein